MNPQTKDIRDLLQALAANQNLSPEALKALRRLACNAVDPGIDVDEAQSSFLETTVLATRSGTSLSATKLLALPPDEALRITAFRLWQHGAQLARRARRQARHQEREHHVDADPSDIETEVRRQHDVPLVARDLREELGPDLLRLLRLRLQGFGFSAIAHHEKLGIATVHSRVQTALNVLRDYTRRQRTSEESGRLALLLIAS